MDYSDPIFKMLAQFVESLPEGSGDKRGEYSKAEVEQVKAIVQALLKYEKTRHIDSIGDQLELFLFLVDLAGGERARAGLIGKLILVKWSKKSKNTYARAYKIGLDHGHIDGSRRTQNRLETRQKKKRAVSGIAKVTKDSDGKQAIKQQVKECWDAWQKQPDRYRGKANFARDMLDKYEALQSQEVIERWCRGWEKGT